MARKLTDSEKAAIRAEEKAFRERMHRLAHRSWLWPR